jgi:hypothetical protein
MESITDVEIDYNLYFTGANTPVFTETGVDTYNFAEWKSSKSYDLNSPDMADPLFTNAASDNFTLQATSPAIDAGVDLGATYDDALDPASSWPSSVTTLDQDLHGKADATQNTPADEATDISVNPTLTSTAFAVNGDWDIGAYVFSSATHTASEWEIDADGGDFSSPAGYDSGEDAVNLESVDTSAGLSKGTAYDWRVRWKTAAGWGAWATKFDFTTVSAYSFVKRYFHILLIEEED